MNNLEKIKGEVVPNNFKPEVLKELRAILADKIETGFWDTKVAKSEADKVRRGEKISWYFLWDMFLTGTLVNKYRISSFERLDEARTIFFKEDIEVIKDKLANSNYNKVSG